MARVAAGVISLLHGVSEAAPEVAAIGAVVPHGSRNPGAGRSATRESAAAVQQSSGSDLARQLRAIREACSVSRGW